MGIIRPMKEQTPPQHSHVPNCRIEFEDIGRVFGSRVVLKGVSGHVTFGEVLVVAGSNGIGKSTLLRILSGLLLPSHGRLNWHAGGAPLSQENVHHYLGYTAPDLHLYRELSGAENLQFFAALRGIPLPHNSLREILEGVGLKGRGRDLVANYSSGMRQRLKLAFALLHQPPLLILDEPTATLDEDGCRIVRQTVDAQRRIGLCILATNERSELDWGDRVLTLSGFRE
jgi:heme exporter protein A